jgi:hypothetical protein
MDVTDDQNEGQHPVPCRAAQPRSSHATESTVPKIYYATCIARHYAGPTPFLVMTSFLLCEPTLRSHASSSESCGDCASAQAFRTAPSCEGHDALGAAVFTNTAVLDHSATTAHSRDTVLCFTKQSSSGTYNSIRVSSKTFS